MVSFGKGSSLRRVAMDGYDISWIPLHKKKQRKRCLPDNQLDKAALERGHRVITHARQRTLSHHVSLQSRPAMASIQLSRDCIGSSSSLSLTLVLLDLVQLHLFLMIQLSMVILETHTVWIRHISTKDGKMETCRIRPETKTVQILLWPGRRPNFLFTWSPRAIEPERPGRSSKGKPKGHWPRRPGRSSEEITQLPSPDLQLLLVPRITKVPHRQQPSVIVFPIHFHLICSF